MLQKCLVTIVEFLREIHLTYLENKNIIFMISWKEIEIKIV